MIALSAFGSMVDRAETLRQVYQRKLSREHKLMASSNVFVICQVDDRGLVGCCLWGRIESDTTEAT